MLKFKKGISILINIFGIACLGQFFLQDMQVQAFEVTIPASVTVNLNETTVNVPGTVTVASSSTLQQSTGTITVSNNGNWSNSGTFTGGSGNVQFTGTSHAINGSSTFYNLNCNISGGQITFEASRRQTISNLLTLKGASGNYLTLRSLSTGTQWELYPQGTTDINYVDVKDSNNVGSSRIQPSNWTDSGNNTNWGPAPAGGAQPTPVPVTLSVSSVSPSSGATGVAVNITVSATFSMYMNGSTLNTSTFKLSGGGGDVSGAVTTNGATATFTPSSNLAYNTTYTATITTGAQAANAAGTTLSSNYTWSFTTISAGVSTPTPTVTTTPTPTPATTSSPTPVPSATPAQTPTPTPTTPGVSGELYLSKTVAYLSGDTVAVTVVDADRNANATLEDTLTTAIKVTALNYYAGGDLMLDLKENGVNSGTFLATIKTGTVTTGGAGVSSRGTVLRAHYFHTKTETAASGGASSSASANIGTIKTVQGGTATVIYTDTAPNVSTIAKTLSFSSSDATLAFDVESYTVGSYAVVTYVDAEENSDHTQEETLLNHVIVETSSINRAWLRLAETGADTGTFKGSILVSSNATIDNERIQASNGDTLTAGCTDEINTSGAPRQVTAVSRVVSAEATPTPVTTPSPTPTPSTTFNMIQVSGGEHQVYFLNSDGTVWGSGKNNLGQLGDGTKVDRNKLVRVGNLDNITTLAVGWYSDLALDSDSVVWAWGRSSSSYLESRGSRITTVPEKVKDIKDVVALSSGKFYCLALKSDGTVWGWGRNMYGQLGITASRYSATPIKIEGLNSVTAVIAGKKYCMALLSDGTVWTWGRNTYGQLGDGTRRNRKKPAQVKSLSDVSAIYAGERHSLAVKSDGTVWAWGRNKHGQLGNGTNTDSNIPVQAKGIADVIGVSGGYKHSIALKSDGTVWAWGGNEHGQLGNGINTDSNIPVQAKGIADVIGVSGGYKHSIALKSDGTVWTWGGNQAGQLGNGTNTDIAIPTQVEFSQNDVSDAGIHN